MQIPGVRDELKNSGATTMLWTLMTQHSPNLQVQLYISTILYQNTFNVNFEFYSFIEKYFCYICGSDDPNFTRNLGNVGRVFGTSHVQELVTVEKLMDQSLAVWTMWLCLESQDDARHAHTCGNTMSSDWDLRGCRPPRKDSLRIMVPTRSNMLKSYTEGTR